MGILSSVGVVLFASWAFVGVSPSNAAEWRPGEVIVVRKAQARNRADALLADHAQARAREITSFKRLGIDHVILEDDMSVDEAVAIYRDDVDNVESAEPNYRVHGIRPVSRGTPGQSLSPKADASVAPFTLTPMDSGFVGQWNMNRISAPQAWAKTTGSRSIIVGIVDSGVDSAHPDLAANLVPGVNFVQNGRPANDTFDDDGHGTHVSGIVGAVGGADTFGVVGVNWQVSLMPLKVLDDTGSGYISDIVNGMGFAADNNARVINMSLGTDTYSAALSQAVAYAQQKNVLVVSAAGNDYNTSVEHPAALGYPNQLAIASTDSLDGISDFSNRNGLEVDVAAPGSSIPSTIPGGGHQAWYGTSMATPHVAGLAALLLARGLTSSYADTRARILGTVDLLTAAHATGMVSGGRINAGRALAPVIVTPNAPTVFIGGLPKTMVAIGGTVSLWDTVGSAVALSQSTANSVRVSASTAGTAQVRFMHAGDPNQQQYLSSTVTSIALAVRNPVSPSATVLFSGAGSLTVPFGDALAGTELVLQNGALAQPTTVRIDEVTSFWIDLPQGSRGVANPVSFQPIDTPVGNSPTFSLSWSPASLAAQGFANASYLNVYAYDTDRSVWVLVPRNTYIFDLVNNRVSFSWPRLAIFRLGGFSQDFGAPVAPPPPPMGGGGGHHGGGCGTLALLPGEESETQKRDAATTGLMMLALCGAALYLGSRRTGLRLGA